MQKTYYTYILASGRNGALYIGVTNNIVRRVGEHKNALWVRLVGSSLQLEPVISSKPEKITV